MNTNNSMDCPADFVPVNAHKMRIIAFLVFVISMIYVFTFYSPLVIFLVADFFARGFGVNKLSFLAWIAEGVIKIFKLGNKPTDRAAKEFAARVGITLSLTVIVFQTGFPKIAMSLAVVLAVFSFLEWFVGFCAGCYLYNLGKKLFPVTDDQ